MKQNNKYPENLKEITSSFMDLPIDYSTQIIKNFTLPTHRQRVAYLSTLPEHILKDLILASTYTFFSTGEYGKPFLSENHMSSEIKRYLDLVETEIRHTCNRTKEGVSIAVNNSLDNVNGFLLIPFISMVINLIINFSKNRSFCSRTSLLSSFSEMVKFSVYKRL